MSYFLVHGEEKIDFKLKNNSKKILSITYFYKSFLSCIKTFANDISFYILWVPRAWRLKAFLLFNWQEFHKGIKREVGARFSSQHQHQRPQSMGRLFPSSSYYKFTEREGGRTGKCWLLENKFGLY